MVLYRPELCSWGIQILEKQTQLEELMWYLVSQSLPRRARVANVDQCQLLKYERRKRDTHQSTLPLRQRPHHLEVDMPQEAVIQLYDECRVIKVLTCSIHDAVERFEIEKRVYERISPHPRVIGYHGMRSGIGHAGGIVLDIAINGSVADYLAEHPNTPGDIRYRWCLEITDALVHLHSNGVIWSDGNPANVLLDAELNSVISDFGGSSIDGSLATAFGPPGYSRLGGTGASPSFHADIFSFGSIIFYILSGSHPYDLGMFGEGFPPLPTNIGSAFARIIQKCWSVDYEATSQLRADVQGAMFATEQSLSSILDRVSNCSLSLFRELDP